MTRTLTGLYDSRADAASTMRDLEAAGIRHEHISVLANNIDERYRSEVKEGNEAGTGAEAGATFGGIVGGSIGLFAGLGMLVIPGVGPVVAAGWLVAAAVGVVGGAAVGGVGGGLLGAMTGNGILEEDAHFYAEGVRRGGTLVTVRVEDNLALKAEAILQEYRRVDPIARRNAYREAGWTRFDETAPPYTDAEIARDMRLRSTTRL